MNAIYKVYDLTKLTDDDEFELVGTYADPDEAALVADSLEAAHIEVLH